RFSVSQRCREWLRDLSNRIVRIDPFMHRTFRQAQRILVTPETLSLVPKDCRAKSDVILAIGLSKDDLARVDKRTRHRSNAPQLLYVGRLLEWKGLDIALRAVHRARPDFPEIRFTI